MKMIRISVVDKKTGKKSEISCEEENIEKAYEFIAIRLAYDLVFEERPIDAYDDNYGLTYENVCDNVKERLSFIDSFLYKDGEVVPFSFETNLSYVNRESKKMCSIFASDKETSKFKKIVCDEINADDAYKFVAIELACELIFGDKPEYDYELTYEAIRDKLNERLKFIEGSVFDENEPVSYDSSKKYEDEPIVFE